MNVHFSGTDAEQNATKGYCLNGTGYIAGITFSAANAGANTSDGIYLKGANHITFQSGVSTANHGYGLNIGSGVSDLFDLGYSYTTSSVSNSLGAWNDPNNALAYRIYHPICVNQNSSLVSCPTSTAYGEQNAFGWTVAGNSAAGRSYGLLVKAGTGSADIAAQIQAADGTNLFSVRGDGLTTIKGNTVPQINGASSSGLVCWKASGALGTCTAGTFPTCTTCN